MKKKANKKNEKIFTTISKKREKIPKSEIKKLKATHKNS